MWASALLLWGPGVGAAERFVQRGGLTYVERADGVLTPTVDASSFEPSREALAGSERVEEGGPRKLAPTSYSLAGWQTPIRDQRDRGTCGVFAAAAAIEARYRRDYGLTLDLSEQYLYHIQKSTSLSSPRTYRYENQSSYWYGAGSYTLSFTTSYPLPLESEAPYLDQTGMNAVRQATPAAGALVWHPDPAQNTVTQAQVDAFEYSPLHIPPVARRNAKYGVSGYVLLNASQSRNTALLEDYISTNREVALDVDLKWRYDPNTGIWQYDASTNGGGHAMLVIGYDRAQNYFLLKNSWGGNDYVKVSYGFIQNAAYSGAVVTGVTDPNAPVMKARWLGEWSMNHDGWAGRLMVRRVPHPAGAATRLGTYYAGSEARDINGTTPQDGRGLSFSMANSSSETTPGSQVGAPFEMYVHGWDPQDASGYTWGGTVRYGSVLKRSALAIPYDNAFNPSKWVGTWNMNHDGWRGQLQITSWSSGGGLWGTYTPQGGTAVPMTGTFDTAKPHSATFTIGNAGSQQIHYVNHFSWSSGFFAGLTYWNGYSFGTQGSK